MAEFKVNTDRLRSHADELEALRDSLNDVVQKLTGMQLGSVIQMKASTALIGRVTKCKWAAIHESGDLGQLSRGLVTIANTYDHVEKELSDPKTQAQADVVANVEPEDLEWLAKVFGGVNPIANLISMFYYGNRGANGDTKSWIKAAKSLFSAVGDVGKFAGDGASAGNWWKALFGTTDTAKDMTDKSLAAFWDKELNKYSFDAQKTAGGKLKVATKWAGTLLTVAATTASNYEEFHGDLTNGRFWEESVLESSLEIGKGMAVSAAVSAALVAAVGSAPAWAVVAIGAGITVGADWLCKNFTKKYLNQEKGVTELVSDAILDMAHGAQEWGQRVSEGVSTWWNSIVGGGSRAAAGAW